MHVTQFSSVSRSCLILALAGMVLTLGVNGARAQRAGTFVPVTDVTLQNPAAEDWLMWRRTLDGWGYSPLDQVDRTNVQDLQMVWSRALYPGRQQATPLAYGGVLYMPNPNDVIQAIDAVTGDLMWEHRRVVPDDTCDYLLTGMCDTNRNAAIYENLIIDTSVDEHVFALDAQRGAHVPRVERPRPAEAQRAPAHVPAQGGEARLVRLVVPDGHVVRVPDANDAFSLRFAPF